MERVVKGRAFTLSKTFYSDGVAATPSGTPTVTLTRLSDGTTVASSAVTGSGVGPYQVTVTAAANDLLDTLTVVWSATVSSQASTYTDLVEVAGDTLFTLAEIRAVTPIDSTVNYLTADILDVRTAVEQAIEQACGVAFVSRYAQERYSGDGSNTLQLRRPLPSSIRSASIGGTALTAPQLADLTMGLSGTVFSSLLCWTWGQNNILVGYESGYHEPPMEIRRAAVLLAKMWLVGRRNPIDDRAITFNAGADGGTYSLAVPGRNGSSFGHPDIDVAIDRNTLATGIA